MRWAVLRNDEARMTFTEHLGELRNRLMISVGVVIVSFFVCYGFSDQIYNLLINPLLATKEITIRSFNPTEAVWVKIQLALYTAIFLSLPVIIYEICAFVFPGLRPGERRVVNSVIFGGGALALSGIALAYFKVLPSFLPLVLAWAPEGVLTDELRMNETVSLIVKFLLGFAVAFQFPLIIFILVFLDLLSPATLQRQRRLAIVVMAIAAAILTPGPDMFSMAMMFIPLYILFEASIWLSYLIVWRRKRRAAEAS
jgi:sec-independent protein translocase protein TatC